MGKQTLIVFAKEPVRGRVKTRLGKHLGKDISLSLYKAFLADTIITAKKTRCDERIVAYISRKGKRPDFIEDKSKGFLLWRQTGKTLGARMHNAFRRAFTEGASKAVIIGSDSPTLPVKFINKAFKLLELNDIVIGPSMDGGYYIIGAKRPCNSLFKSIKWSSKNVFSDTVRIADKASKKISILDKWFDVDNIESFNYLKKSLKKESVGQIAQNTREILSLYIGI